METIFNPLLKKGFQLIETPGGGGDVVGPASSTDNAIVRFNGTTGVAIQNSTVTIDDLGNVIGVTSLGINKPIPVEDLHVVGNFQVDDADIATKGYRFRTSGSALDLDASGQPIYFSVYENPGFTGTQRIYLTLESASSVAQAVGKWQWHDGGVPWGTVSTIIDTGNFLTSGYLRVGSVSAPTNTTAGDLTFVRGFGSGATQLNSLTLTTDLAVADGGTGASTAADARTNLGLVAGGAGDIWVEKAGDTMSGELTLSKATGNDLTIGGTDPDVTSGAMVTFETEWAKKLVFWGDSIEGYTRLEFRPERRTGGDSSDVQIVVHKLLRSTSDIHRHFSIYTTNALQSPTKRLNIDYLVDISEFELANSRMTINDVGVLGAADYQLYINNTSAQVNATRMLYIWQQNASGTAAVAEIENEGSGSALTLDQNGIGQALFIDHDDTGTGISFNLDRDGNSASVITGQQIDVDNAGAGGATGLDIFPVTATGGAVAGLRIRLPSGGATNYALDMADTTGVAAGGITFGTDTQLYRSAANTLKLEDQFLATVAGNAIRATNTTDNASVQALIIEGDRATIANNDEVYASFYLSDSGGAQEEFGRITLRATNVTDTTEGSRMAFSVRNGGNIGAEVFITASATSPAANDGNALGTTSLMWSDLFLASGGVINFNNGNATITHSAGLLTSNVDIAVPDEVYGVGWNGSLEVPTKNAVYDKIEALSLAGGVPGGADTQVQFNDVGAFGGDAGLTYNKTTDTLTAGNLVLTTALPVAQGGTGATTAAVARTNLGAQPSVFYTVGATNADYITDGTADEVQINQAITDANAAGGGIVHLKEATFTHAAEIVMLDNIILEGEGVGTIIKKATATNIHQINFIGVDNAVVRDLQIDGNKANEAGLAGKCINFITTASTNILLENLYIHDGIKHGIFTDSAVAHNNIIISNCNIKDMGTSADGSGIYLGGVTNFKIENVWTTGHTLDGVQFDASTGQLINVHSYSNGRSGIYPSATSTVEIANSKFYSNTSIGIQVDTSSKIDMVNSKVYSNGNDGIRFTSVSGSRVVGCEIYDNGTVNTSGAIRLVATDAGHTCNRHVINGNSLYDSGAATQEYGIIATGSGTVDYNIVNGNSIYGNVTSQFLKTTWGANNIEFNPVTGIHVPLATDVGLGTFAPVDSLQIHNTTAADHLSLTGTAPYISFSELEAGTDRGGIGLATSNGNFASGVLTNDLVIRTTTAGGDIVFATGTSPTRRVHITDAGMLVPASSDGAALGTTALMWSDLFLASGGVINFNNGNATLTHSAGLLTSNVPLTLPRFTVDGSDTTETVINEGSFEHNFRIETATEANALVVVGADNEINIRVNTNLSAGNLNVVAGLTTLVDLKVNETAYFDGEVDDGNSSTADTIDWTTGNMHKSTLTGNVKFTYTVPPGPCSFTHRLIQDATGSRTLDEIVFKTTTFATSAVNTTTEEITLNIDVPDRSRIRFSSTTAVPAGLVAGTIYYAIRVSATVIKVASTYALAVAGTAIDLTSQGTGTHTIEVLVKWPSGTKPTLSTAAGAVDVLTFKYDGSEIIGMGSLAFS